MASRKDNKPKATKKHASAARGAAGKPRAAALKVPKKTSSKVKAVSAAGRDKTKGKKSKERSKPKVTAKVKTVSKLKVAPGAKSVSKPKVPPRPKTLSKAKASKEKTKPSALVQKKKPMPKEDDFRITFTKSLKLKKEEIEQTLERLMKSRKEYEGQLTAGDFIDEVDDAQREISAYSQFSLIERKNKELQKIEYLLNRIAEEQDFGLCEECGTRIPKERLLLVPEATLCVACQRELEKIDSRMSVTTRPSGFSPTRREVTWETTEPPDEDDNLLVEYHIGTLPDVDIEENDTEPSPEDKEDKES